MKKDEAYILRRVNVSLNEPFNKIEEFKSYVEKNINDSNLNRFHQKFGCIFCVIIKRGA